ncbi:MAG: dephospho-CoA kinase [Oscillospiraceae bacterium]|jgi:dephospho-CoA kinase|nr:dephospho-CoA kinase [Oscillospiraceae bacterium]
MKVIGITGGSGSGKTSVLRMMERLGCFAVDADEVYHKLLVSDKILLNGIKEYFPEAFDGDSLNRGKLGYAVFGNDEKLKELNKITHPRIIREINHILDVGRLHDAPMAVIDATLLIESGVNEICDLVIGVVAPPEVRLARILERDRISEEAARRRVDSQPGSGFYQENCDYIIDNSKDDDSILDKTVGFYDNLVNGKITKKTSGRE